MYLRLLDAEPRGVRETYALASCNVSYFPKREPRDVLIDGAPAKMAITGSRNYATAATAGNNGYVMIDGVCYWMSFAAGFAAATEPLEFEVCEGKAPDENPLRDPKDAAKEKARRENLSKALKAKFSGAKDAADDLDETEGEADHHGVIATA